jgi:hypothetical protein
MGENRLDCPSCYLRICTWHIPEQTRSPSTKIRRAPIGVKIRQCRSSAGRSGSLRTRVNARNVHVSLGGDLHKLNPWAVPRIGRYCMDVIGSWGAPLRTSPDRGECTWLMLIFCIFQSCGQKRPQMSLASPLCHARQHGPSHDRLVEQACPCYFITA